MDRTAKPALRAATSSAGLVKVDAQSTPTPSFTAATGARTTPRMVPFGQLGIFRFSRRPVARALPETMSGQWSSSHWRTRTAPVA